MYKTVSDEFVNPLYHLIIMRSMLTFDIPFYDRHGLIDCINPC